MKDWKQGVLDFWFIETAPVQWFQVSSDFDALVRARFLSLYEAARSGAHDFWAQDADGALALCLVFDQFPRILFRGQARAYESDAKAVQIAALAVSRGFDQVLAPLKRRFFYLPFEHSEHPADQEKSVALFASMRHEDPLSYEYALRQADIIRRFGRFPARNRALGRAATDGEEKFLSSAAN